MGHLHGSHLANAKCRVADTKGALPGYQKGYLSAWTEDNVIGCFPVWLIMLVTSALFVKAPIGSLLKFKRLKAKHSL